MKRFIDFFFQRFELDESFYKGNMGIQKPDGCIPEKCILVKDRNDNDAYQAQMQFWKESYIIKNVLYETTWGILEINEDLIKEKSISENIEN